jgi:hypothetical protein
MKKKETEEITKKTPKKRKVFHTEAVDDASFYDIPSFMETDLTASSNNKERIEQKNEGQEYEK